MYDQVTLGLNVDPFILSALKEDITQEDIKAKYENGILRLSVPKKEAKPVETKKTIAIEG